MTHRYTLLPPTSSYPITKPNFGVCRSFSKAHQPTNFPLLEKGGFSHLRSLARTHYRTSVIPVAMEIRLNSSPSWPEWAPSSTQSPSTSQLFISTEGRIQTFNELKQHTIGSSIHETWVMRDRAKAFAYTTRFSDKDWTSKLVFGFKK